jgi:hypothetical protein
VNQTNPPKETFMAAATFSECIEILRRRTGVVIPVYFPEGIDVQRGEALLRDTVSAYCTQVADPASVCLSVDGNLSGANVAGQLAQEYGVSTYIAPVNRGKLHAAINGVRLLLENPNLAYVAVVDQDGDHFANELVNFVRAAQHIVVHAGDTRVMVLGRRISRHRPMGLLRGELEEYADRITLDALAYRAATTSRPLRLEYAFALDEFPDFHSGYKLFSRTTAERVFLGEPRLAGVSETCYYRHACEAVMVVEALEHGAYLGVVNRSTFNEQPISTFGLLKRDRLVADKILWPCKRLEVPLSFVRQWLANHTPRLLLSTLTPHGQEELARIRQLVIASYTDGQSRDSDSVLHPLFV